MTEAIKNSTVSVIVPACNEELTICSTIKSLINQNFNSYEIIVVDDGSRDCTASVIAKEFKLHQNKSLKTYNCLLNTAEVRNVLFAEKDGVWIFLIKKQNGGKSDALNAGINYSHGDYIVCIDADCELHRDAIAILAGQIEKNQNIAAVGGRVIPSSGINDYIKANNITLNNILRGHQDIEYGAAFTLARPLLDKIGTSMLISGAIGIFRKDVIIAVGGYATDTVGEDMEIILRIRKYAAEHNLPLEIRYSKQAKSVTELPHNGRDYAKQRIRWAVGLTENLRKYRDMASFEMYSLPQKVTYWYYLLFEKLMPHFELTWLLICCFLHRWNAWLFMVFVPKPVQLVIALAGSWESLKNAVLSSAKKRQTIMRIVLLLATYLTVYHFGHSMLRLIALPVDWIQKKRNRVVYVGWKSPQRNKNEKQDK